MIKIEQTNHGIFGRWYAQTEIMEPIVVTFALEDYSHGYEITPSRVPIDDLIEFSKEVRDFIQGSDKEVGKDDLIVAVRTGSLELVSEPLEAPKLRHDILLLNSSPDLSLIDAKRRAILENWQKSTKLHINRAIRIASDAFAGVIRINNQSDFTVITKENWVSVERYIRGELQDLGGIKSSNAHIRMSDGQKLTIKTNKDLVRAQSVNRVYHDVTVRIKAKLNLYTGEIKDAELIEFVEYAPKFDENQFEAMTQKGRNAWSDVPDHVRWIRELRGSD